MADSEQKVDKGIGGKGIGVDASREIPTKRKRRLFAPGLLANNDLAILLYGFAILFAGVLIPTTHRSKLISAALVVIFCVALLFYGYRKRNVPTDEEISEGFRRDTGSALGRIAVTL